jgi:RNA polymerase-binding transcription factor DksA
MTTTSSLKTDAVRQTIEARLEVLHDEIVGKLGEMAEVLQSLDHIGDHADLSVADNTRSSDLAEASRDVAEYQEGLAALKRLDHDLYGVCTDCAEPIPDDRLQAQPFAVRCLACQTHSEKASGTRHESI